MRIYPCCRSSFSVLIQWSNTAVYKILNIMFGWLLRQSTVYTIVVIKRWGLGAKHGWNQHCYLKWKFDTRRCYKEEILINSALLFSLMETTEKTVLCILSWILRNEQEDKVSTKRQMWCSTHTKGSLYIRPTVTHKTLYIKKFSISNTYLTTAHCTYTYC